MSILLPLLLTCSAPAAPQETDSPWIWPLSGDLYAPRELFNTHGQLQILASGEPLLHRGIDIKAAWSLVPWGVLGVPPFEVQYHTDTEVVRSSIDGVVRFVLDNPGDQNDYVVVSPAADSDWGLRFLHLESIWVSEGESVFRGEALGKVALWSGDPSFTHLDLALVQCPGASPCTYPPILGNPLPWMSSRADHVAPQFHELSTGGGTPGPTMLFLDDSGDPISSTGPPAGLQGEVDVLVRVSDRFATTAAPGPVNVPLRVRVSVRRLYLTLVGAAGPPPGLHTPLVYSNKIEFLDPIDDTDALAPKCYRLGTGTFDSADDDFYVIATHGIGAEGGWDTTKTGNGLHTVEVTAEDASGNLSSTTTIVWVMN